MQGYDPDEDPRRAEMEWVDMGNSVLTPEAVRYITKLHERLSEECARSDRMEAALRAVEWVKGADYDYCYVCLAAKDHLGHAPNCLIGLALAGEKGE